jgi:predicted metalloprotease with PDZ domain
MNSQNKAFVKYYISMPDPVSHEFSVSVKFDNIKEKEINLIMPVWRPGRYFILDFSSGVYGFSASSDNQNLKWKKINKYTWQIKCDGCKSITANYKLYANEFNLRTRGLNEEHAFINGTAVFMYAEKFRKVPVLLTVESYNNWHITTGLENAEGKKNVFTTPDYDYLADCPLEIGNQKDIEFDVQGKQHVISFFGEANYDENRLKDDFIKIIEANYRFWNFIPYKRYVFIVHCGPNSGGGTEHINSTVVGVTPDAFGNEKMYMSFLRLISHEFFHTWNVKQIRPEGITPYNYIKENYTKELWIAEGGTSYYDGMMLLRTGHNKAEDIYKEICSSIEEDRRRPGNKIQAVSESSFDAWVKFWKNTPQKFDAESDYYVKGSYVNMILDLEIRHRTKNEKSLDDVYSELLKRYPLGSEGYTNKKFRKICDDITGTSFKQFFNDYVDGVKEIEWEKFISYAGLNAVKNEDTVKPVVGIYAAQ